MEKKFRKNKAGHIPSNKKVTMIISILAVTLFIGAAIQPVMAGTLPDKEPESQTVEEECLPCKGEEPVKVGPSCKTCACAMDFAVWFMVDFVDDNLADGPFLIKSGELVGLIFLGLIKGFKESGFKIEIDSEDLKTNITYWVDKLVEPDNYWFNVTEILANLVAIAIGITAYLLTLCGDSSPNLPDETQNKQIITSKTSILTRIITIIIRLSLLIQ